MPDQSTAPCALTSLEQSILSTLDELKRALKIGAEQSKEREWWSSCAASHCEYSISLISTEFAEKEEEQQRIKLIEYVLFPHLYPEEYAFLRQKAEAILEESKTHHLFPGDVTAAAQYLQPRPQPIGWSVLCTKLDTLADEDRDFTWHVLFLLLDDGRVIKIADQGTYGENFTFTSGWYETFVRRFPEINPKDVATRAPQCLPAVQAIEKKAKEWVRYADAHL